MSDNDDDYMCEEEEDYGLEYSEDSNSEPDVDLENQYYNSKALKEDEPGAALLSLQKVLELEGGDKGEWGFKALKQMIKINFKLNNFTEMMVRYKQLLTYIKSAVTRNHSEKSINSILDYISTSKNMELLQDFYETTLEALKDAKNDRLWFKTNSKLGKLYYDRGDFNKLAKILKQLHQSCQTDDGEDDLKKGTQLLEIYALEIQMYTAQKNNKKLKALYEQSLHINSAIPHPLIMGVIRECGGKMHLREGEFEKAHTDFFEAFKNYDESGSPRRTTCLKYLVLANMLMKSGINPFDSQEAKPYENDPEILAMTNLVMAYQNNDINDFESILKHNRNNIMDDPFIRELIEDLLRNIRTQVLIKLIGPYTKIHIPFISKELNIDEKEVENLLVTCILDNAGTKSANFNIAVLGEIKVDSVEIGIGDVDGTTSPKLTTVTYPNKLTEKLQADHLQKVSLKFSVRDKWNKPVLVQQAFVRVAAPGDAPEAIFVAEPDNAKAYRVDLNVAAMGKLLQRGGEHSLRLLLGDSAAAAPVDWPLGLVALNFAPGEPAAEAVATLRSARPEIAHTFRAPEPRPPRVVSDVFAAACAAPLLLLLVLWARLRVNLSALPAAPAALVFHLALGASLGLYALLWLRLSMFDTLRYLAPLAALTFLAGHRLLRRLVADKAR